MDAAKLSPDGHAVAFVSPVVHAQEDRERTQDVLNIQAVIPAKISDNWILISRIIQPIIWQPYPSHSQLGATGTLYVPVHGELLNRAKLVVFAGFDTMPGCAMSSSFPSSVPSFPSCCSSPVCAHFHEPGTRSAFRLCIPKSRDV